MIMRVHLPRWVRVLAFLRVPFAVRRRAAVRFWNRALERESETILTGARERLWHLLMYGWCETTQACSTCLGSVEVIQRLDGSVECRQCWEKRPKFYGPGIGELLTKERN